MTGGKSCGGTENQESLNLGEELKEEVEPFGRVWEHTMHRKLAAERWWEIGCSTEGLVPRGDGCGCCVVVVLLVLLLDV